MSFLIPPGWNKAPGWYIMRVAILLLFATPLFCHFVLGRWVPGW